MTDATPPAVPTHVAPSTLASIVSKGVGATEAVTKKVVAAVTPHVAWAFDWTTYLLGLQAAWKTLVLLCRNWYAWVILVPVGIFIYSIGHYEEATKAKAVFTQLSSCVTSLGQAKAELAKPAKVAACPAVSPAPVIEAPPEAPPAPKAATPHKKKKPSPGLLGGLFGK